MILSSLKKLLPIGLLFLSVNAFAKVSVVKYPSGSAVPVLQASGSFTSGNGLTTDSNGNIIDSGSTAGAVTTDSTLQGNGSGGSPLGLNLASSNTWTGSQIFGGTKAPSAPGTGTTSEQWGSEALAGNGSGSNNFAFGANSQAGTSNGNSRAMALGLNTTANFSNCLALGEGSTITGQSQVVVGSSANRLSSIYFGSGVTNASVNLNAPVNINATGGSGTNKGGLDIILAGGISTGTGTGGTVHLQSSPAGTTGTSANSLSDIATFSSNGNVNIPGLTASKPVFTDSSQNLTSTGTVAVSNGGTGSTTYTAGAIPVSNGTVLTQDPSNFFYDLTNHRLGLGTASPGATLQVNGAASGITSIFRNNATTPGNLTEWHDSSGTVLSSVSSAGHFIMGDTQTASASCCLGINAGSTQAFIVYGVDSAGLRTHFGVSTGTANLITGNCEYWNSYKDSNGWIFNSAKLGTGTTRRMRWLMNDSTVVLVMNTDGRTGVGNVLSPSAQLHVVSSAAGTIGAIVQAASTPSVNILELQDSSAVAHLSFGIPAATGATLTVGADTDTLGTIALRGNNSATGNGCAMNWYRGGTFQWQFGVDGNTSTGANSFWWYNVPAAAYRMGLSTSGTLTVLPAASTKGLIIKANATTPGNLQEWQDSSAATLSFVSSTGTIALPDGTASAPMLQRASNTNYGLFWSSTYGFGFSQIGVAYSFQDSLGLLQRPDGVVRWNANNFSSYAPDVGLSRNAAGILEVNNATTGQWAALRIGSIAPGSSTVALMVRGAASQSVNLQEWQSSTPTTLSYVDSSGDFVAPVGTKTAPGYQFNGVSSTGIFANGQNVVVSSNNTNCILFNSAVVRLSSGVILCWSSGDTNVSGPDTGMSRSAAGQIGFTNGGATTYATIGTTGLTLTPTVQTTGSPNQIVLTGAAHTTLTASTEAIDANFNLARTVQFATGALTTQRAFVIQAPTYGFVGASTITTAVTLDITGAPAVGTNATITNAYSLRAAGLVRFTTGARITPRVTTAADATSITPNTDSADVTYQANTQTAGTLTINADGGTPENGQKWILKIKSTNVQTFSWNAVYVSGSGANAVTLPTTCTGSSKIDQIGFIYDSANSKWECAAVATGY